MSFRKIFRKIKTFRLDQAGVKKELKDGIHKIEMTQIMHSHVLSDLSAVVVSS